MSFAAISPPLTAKPLAFLANDVSDAATGMADVANDVPLVAMGVSDAAKATWFAARRRSYAATGKPGIGPEMSDVAPALLCRMAVPVGGRPSPPSTTERCLKAARCGSLGSEHQLDARSRNYCVARHPIVLPPQCRDARRVALATPWGVSFGATNLKSPGKL